MRLISGAADAADWLIDRIGGFTAWLTLAMVLLISGNTLSRYFFNASTVWLVVSTAPMAVCCEGSIKVASFMGFLGTYSGLMSAAATMRR